MSINRTNWQSAKKLLTLTDQKLFREDLGPHLDKAADAYKAFEEERNKTMKRKGPDGQVQDVKIPDLVRLAEKCDKGDPVCMKALDVSGRYKAILNTLPATTGSLVRIKAVLAAIESNIATQRAKMRNNRPTDNEVKQFRLACLDDTLKATFPAYKAKD